MAPFICQVGDSFDNLAITIEVCVDEVEVELGGIGLARHLVPITGEVGWCLGDAAEVAYFTA